MKNLFRLALLAMLAFAMTSCADTEKFLIKADGEWNIETFDWTLRTVAINSATSDTTDIEEGIEIPTNSGTVTFEKDGKGVLSGTESGITLSFNFSYTIDEDAETITMTFEDQLFFPVPIIFNIDESTKDVQRYSVSNNSETTTGDVTTTVTENGTVVLNKN